MRGLKTLKLENGAALRGGSMGSQGCRIDLRGWRISDLKVRRHRGSARTLSDTPIGPMAPPLEVRGGTNFETKIFKFMWFLGTSNQNELYHTPLLSKI